MSVNYLSDDQIQMLEDYLLLFPRTEINGKYTRMGTGVVVPDYVSLMWCGLVERVLTHGTYKESDRRILNGEVRNMVKANREWIAQKKFNNMFADTV